MTVNGAALNVNKNSFLYIPSGVEYTLGNKGDGAMLIGINFDFEYTHSHLVSPISPVTSKSDFDSSRQVELAEFSDLKYFEQPFILHGQGELGAILCSILDEFTTSKIFHSHAESALLKQVLLAAARLLTTGADSSPQKTADRVIAYIQDNYMHSISNADIGFALNFHPNYLNRIMLRQTGRSLHGYLLYFRLSKALERLQSTDLSVSKIAEQCGFNDAGHFTKTFKKQFGCSPKEMRGKLI